MLWEMEMKEVEKGEDEKMIENEWVEVKKNAWWIFVKMEAVELHPWTLVSQPESFGRDFLRCGIVV